jgi:hypothetical protein
LRRLRGNWLGGGGEMVENGGAQRKEIQKVDCDREVWVMNSINAAIRMALAVKKECRVGADEQACQEAIRGIIEGTAIEIIRTLGMEPSYVNIRKPLTKLI